jgi:hypothetical protein
VPGGSVNAYKDALYNKGIDTNIIQAGS